MLGRHNIKKADTQKTPFGLSGGGHLQSGETKNFKAEGSLVFLIRCWKDAVVTITSKDFANINRVTALEKGDEIYAPIDSITVTSGEVFYYFI